MVVYHGSFTIIEKPDVCHSRKNVDFGKAFYVTPIVEQARKWGRKFIDKGCNAFVSRFEFDENKAKIYKVKRFESYSNEWLDYVISCRNGMDESDFDIVIGGVANDKVFNTVELYLQNLIDKAEALKRLKYEKPNLQIAFRSQSAIDECLAYIGCDQL